MWGIELRTVLAILIGALAIVLALIVILIRRKKSYGNPYDDMNGEDFEDFCAYLLDKNGFENIEMTAKSHDYGIDIFAEKDNISYAIQCKCYSDPVGIKAVQEAYAGRDYYDKMVGVVMTNQVFTQPAMEFANKLNIMLWDGRYIEELEWAKAI